MPAFQSSRRELFGTRLVAAGNGDSGCSNDSPADSGDGSGEGTDTENEAANAADDQ